jgi:predicted metal-dependent phosphoesterase TrpH
VTADLHLHSTYSDGLLTPSELVHKAAAAGVGVMALTDHDATDGLAEATIAAHEHPGLVLIPGIELSTDVADGEVHVLGYFIDVNNSDLQEILSSFREDRVGRARQILERLTELGLSLEWDRVQEIAGDGAIGRPHVAEAMLERGYVESIRDAFDRYLGRSGSAYLERRKLAPVQAIEIIRRFGGVSALAHPREAPDLESLLPVMKEAGLVGMEVHYGLYPDDERDRFATLAKRHQLLAVGGSDYHGPGRAAECPLGGSRTPIEAGQALLALRPD